MKELLNRRISYLGQLQKIEKQRGGKESRRVPAKKRKRKAINKKRGFLEIAQES